MWVKPELVSPSALWSTERLNSWFVLQKRRGHGGDVGLPGTLLKSVGKGSSKNENLHV